MCRWMWRILRVSNEYIIEEAQVRVVLCERGGMRR